jgi:hypothetical protein
LVTSLVAFNVGVELGQVLVLVVLVPLLSVLFRFVVAERMGTIILSALVAHTGWHWMIDRGNTLSEFPFAWPVVNAAFLAGAMRWLAVVLGLAGLLWAVSRLLEKREVAADPRKDGTRAQSY